MNTILDISSSEEIYTVSRFNRNVRFLLETHFASFVWLEGEISNFTVPQSGHWYFSLKDAAAQIRCAMFRQQNRQVSFSLQDGMHVLVKARVSLYEGRGDFQLIIETMEEMGEGKLQKEFEKLKKRLLEAGLFDPAHKKKIPSFPTTIGIITSSTGAAIQDILTILHRRFRLGKIIIYPTLVQGELAANHIVSAIQTANHRQECDVLLLARGGGSLEDLWPFNEEKVAHAIYQSVIPTISGIGHEIDFTISDFVADLRAPTPSAAAELATPDSEELQQTLARDLQQLRNQLKKKVVLLQQSLGWAGKHLQQHYLNRLSGIQYQLHFKSQHLKNKMEAIIQWHRKKIDNAMATVTALSPLATLQRGFAIVTTVENPRVLQDSHDIQPGNEINVRLTHGILNCTVNQITE